MVERAIVVGDQVINLQMPGIFTVTARDRTFLHIESPDGIRLKVSDAAVRRMEPGATPIPVDPPEE
ncbi:MAG TPA: hypothetical protein VGR62_21110 [Candidatus Binatia bacterium]|jgi:hypothetical protein|nr:hypothetical protein [Candidatus Binatia bacterium]